MRRTFARPNIEPSGALTGTVRVMIATTEGPAEITNIRSITPSLDSLVRIRGGRDQAGISTSIEDSYPDFVADAISKLFRNGPFELEVSRNIESGPSWQAAVLLAHALLEAGRLATEGNTEARTLVWLTGAVDADLSLLAVDDVPRKLDLSLRDFEDEIGRGVHTVIVCVPAANAPDIAELPVLDALKALGVQVRLPSTATQLFEIFGVPRFPAHTLLRDERRIGTAGKLLQVALAIGLTLGVSSLLRVNTDLSKRSVSDMLRHSGFEAPTIGFLGASFHDKMMVLVARRANQSSPDFTPLAEASIDLPTDPSKPDPKIPPRLYIVTGAPRVSARLPEQQWIFRGILSNGAPDALCDPQTACAGFSERPKDYLLRVESAYDAANEQRNLTAELLATLSALLIAYFISDLSILGIMRFLRRGFGWDDQPIGRATRS